MSHKPSVTVGICAYNSEGLIETLLQSIVSQNLSLFNLKRIIVHCDLSGDQTFEKTQAWIKKHKHQKLIKIVRPAKKLGFAGSFKATLNLSRSNIVVMLNDDILIKDQNFLNKVIKEFNQPNIGLAAVNLKQLPHRSFVEKAINSSMKVYKEVRLVKNHGNNLFTCDGKVLILSKKFIGMIKFPKKLGLVGNLDAYLYMTCLFNGLNYIYIAKACVYHHNPATIKEYLTWTSRNNSNYYLLKQTFGDLAKKEYELPKRILWQKKLEQFFKNPLECAFLFATSFYITIQAKKQALNFNPKWDNIRSTKVIK